MSEIEVTRWIPHRPPFLFVDRVIERSADRVVTSVQADPDAAFFAGHYPGDPVMPGVLILECAFQAGALLAAARAGDSGDQMARPVLTRIQEAKFKRQVRPGQVLTVEVTLDEQLDQAFFMTGRITADGQLVSRVVFACSDTRKGGS